MNDAVLKAKVLFGAGVLVSILGAIYTPDLVKAMLPIALCVVVASIALLFPELCAAVKKHLAKRASNGSQATPLFRSMLPAMAENRVMSVPTIDYDNYLIPTYLRRQEVK